ncbi:MAG: alpha/beta hydrolase [Xanthomonadales bacterium]|nr:alpha/beta hydrolase [Xanthomonadales bacterium]
MRTLVSILIIATSGYLLLLLMLYLFQGRMVFLSDFPDRALVASPGDIGLDYEDVSLTTSDDEHLHGWYIPALDSKGVLLFFHGNAGNISHRLDSIKIFQELGLDVLIIDYRGYGKSTGTTSEQGTYLDAQAAWDYLVNSRGVPADRIIVFGRSLGGAIGAWLSAQNTPAAVIIESSFSSGVDMARRFYPFLPASLITRLRYPVVDYAGRLNCPVLVVHSRHDEIIPFAMGRAIYAAVKQHKKFLEIRGDHNNGFLISQADYVAALNDFIRTSLSH